MQLGFSLRFVTIIYKVEILRVSADWMDKKQLGEKIFLKIVWMFKKIYSLLKLRWDEKIWKAK